MNSVTIWIILAAGLLTAAALFMIIKWPRGPAVPARLRKGETLPEFDATDKNGNTVSSSELRGKPAVILFVRGNWCPFCTKQVKKLTSYYKEIAAGGARLVFVTPKPLETTQRVADFFNVEFEFWQDHSLAATKALGLAQPNGVPKDHHKEYGPDTVWPTAIITDKDNKIRYSKLARFLFDRPDPQLLVNELQKI